MSADRPALFDEVERADDLPARHQESSFEFLNRVAGDYWAQPRALMQQWLERIPGEMEYNDLRQRFRSRSDEQFRSAFLELYLHESLSRAGYEVTVHPPLEGTSRRPDFLAERDEIRFYVEAIAPGATPEGNAAAARRAVLFDTVDAAGDPNFMLSLEELREGRSQPASARLRDHVRRWLRHLDPDTVTSFEDAPTTTWERDGWSVTFRAIPIRPDARGVREGARAIGIYGHGEAGIIDDAPAIQKALSSKHHEYGDLGAPFVIAVSSYIHDTDRWHSRNAMFGREGVSWGRAPDGSVVTTTVRHPDGYFGVPPEWAHRNVSGVLLVNQLMPYHAQRAETTLWRHPSPIQPLPVALGLPCLEVSLDDLSFKETPPSIEPAEFFGLPDHWPEGDPWPDRATESG